MSSQTPPKFEKSQMVRLRRDKSKGGVIYSEPLLTERGWQYEVFFSSDDRRFLIEADLTSSVEMEVDEAGHIRFGNIDDLLRSLLLLKIRQPVAEFLYGVYASRTKFEVYQFKPALKFLGNPDQRLLIADEVGLGKTIEAGIIYLELHARLDLMRVLVVCPPALKLKWQDEMRSRFDENFTILESEHLNRLFDDYRRHGENTRLRGIVSLPLLRRRERAETIAEMGMHFDLVIIDEAHHCRNPTTLSHNIASVLSDNADAMLLLTATPLHLGNQDLFHLLNILDPGDFDYLESFEVRIVPNRYINRAAQYLEAGNHTRALTELRNVEHQSDRSRFLGNPYYRETVGILRERALSREQLVQARRNLLELNTLAHIFTRTRKREVVINAPVREAHALKVSFTPIEQDFYNAVIEFVRAQFSHQTGNRATGWATVMRERQAASCISAARDLFRGLIRDQYRSTPEDEYLFQELAEDMDSNGFPISSEARLRLALEQLTDLAIAIGETDTKFDVFYRALKEVIESDADGKILVFSYFRGTLDYLQKRLDATGIRVLKMHGAIPVRERSKIVEDFRDNPEVRVLLSSEVGSEGLDFQFCHTLFNYDLPWNPMKVEQRIGRLDRFGQKHPKINIYNLVIEESIEERIFLRLYQRIGIFKETVGDLEAILGEEIRNLSKQLFTTTLSPRQEQELADMAATNIIRRKQELEEFEQQRIQFMGQDAIFDDEVRTAIDSGKFVSEAEIRAMVETFINANFERSRLKPDEEDPTVALLPGDDFITYMRNFVYEARPSDQSAKDFLKRLKAGRWMPMTYSAEVAFERKLVEFITLRHPIALAAARYWEEEPSQDLPVFLVELESESEPAGDFYFFVFTFFSEGIKEGTHLVPIAVSAEKLTIEPDLQPRFLRLLQSASLLQAHSRDQFDGDAFQRAREVAKQYAANERDRQETELRRSNEALVNQRLSAIESTYQIKRKKVREFLRSATHPSIKRMREAQLRNLDASYAAKKREIEKQRQVSVSFGLSLAGLASIRLVPAEKPLRAEDLGADQAVGVPARPVPAPKVAQRKKKGLFQILREMLGL